MTYNKDSFLAGLAVGRTLKGWAGLGSGGSGGSGGSAIPEPYASYIEEAKRVYTGSYANVIYAEGYGADTGVTYHTVMFLLDNWSISAYDAATTGYTHSGFIMVQKEDDGAWTMTDYSNTSTDTHYAKNIKAASCYIEYEGLTLFPVGIGYNPQIVAYLYNGVRLPKLPKWDKATYPYATIIRNSKYSSSMEYIAYISEKAPYVYPSTNAFGNPGFWLRIDLPWSFAQIDAYRDSKWWFIDGGYIYDAWKSGTIRQETCVELNGEEQYKVMWTNYDLYNEDGTLRLAASEPVPVYE